LKHTERIHIVAVADDRYAQHLGVNFTSLLMHKSQDRSISLHVIDGGISPWNKHLLQFTLEKLGAKINFLTINTDIYLDLVVSQHITKAAYYRLSIPDLFTEIGVDKVIYMDCDLIVKEDISLLWDIPLSEYTIAAVGDIGGIFRLEDLSMPSTSQYFNSGVMVINLTKWRKDGVTNTVLDFLLRNPEKIHYHDQDGLNAILYNDWLALPPNWNMQNNMLDRTTSVCFSEKELKEAKRHPSIIHFTGTSKPWQYDNTHPYKKEYYKYLKMTAWHSYKPKKSMKIILKRIVKEITPHPILLFFIYLKSIAINHYDV
jgi:lipopolysaccharide biosynthesis glycosyltransferase